MSTAWTIRMRRNAAAVRRPASLSSLPDLSDDLEIGSRPSSGASGLFEPWASNDADNIAPNALPRSNISVSYFGSRIQRQYRSSFVLSDNQIIGVTRCETFHPEDAKADVRVNLALQGPPNESMVPGRKRSQSAPCLIRDSLDANRGWARLMLTTDRPRDSELLGRVGSRGYFAKTDSNAPRLQRRITPLQKEEEFIYYSHSTALDGVPLASGGINGTALDGEPSTERVEKDTSPETNRFLGKRIEAPVATPSPNTRTSSSDKALSDDDNSGPKTEVFPKSPSLPYYISPQNLPSTERSESILLIPRSKSESNLASPRAPWLEPLHRTSIQVYPPLQLINGADNTLSLNTDFEDDEGITGIPLARAQNTEESNSLSFVSATNGIVIHLGSPQGQERISSFQSEALIKSTVLYATLNANRVLVFGESSGENSNAGSVLGTTSEGGEVTVTPDCGSIDLNPVLPKPRERKRLWQEDEEGGSSASQTEDSLSQNGTVTKVSDQNSPPAVSEKLSAHKLPPRPEERMGQRGNNSFSDSHSPENRYSPASSRGSPTSPKATPRRVKNAKQDYKIEEIVIQSEEFQLHGTPFRSPFDPRSDEEVFSSHGEDEDPANDLGWPEESFDVSELTNGDYDGSRKESNSLNAYDDDVIPQPAPRSLRKSWEMTEGDEESSQPIRDKEISSLDEEEEEDEDSWGDEESRLRPPALHPNIDAALAELPVEDPATRTKRLRPLQYPLYVNTRPEMEDTHYARSRAQALRTVDQNIPEKDLPDTLVVRTRRRTMSGVTGFLPRTNTLSTSSVWFGDHPVPSKTQIYAAEQSPLRLSSIQLQAQAEIARRRSRSNLSSLALSGRSRSLERMASSTSVIYGPTGRRIHGGAPTVERARKRHASKRDGYETLSVVHVPRLEEGESTLASIAAAAEQRRLRRPASSASMAQYRSVPALERRPEATKHRDEARSLIAQAAVDLAVHSIYDLSEV